MERKRQAQQQPAQPRPDEQQPRQQESQVAPENPSAANRRGPRSVAPNRGRSSAGARPASANRTANRLLCMAASTLAAAARNRFQYLVMGNHRRHRFAARTGARRVNVDRQRGQLQAGPASTAGLHPRHVLKLAVAALHGPLTTAVSRQHVPGLAPSPHSIRWSVRGTPRGRRSGRQHSARSRQRGPLMPIVLAVTFPEGLISISSSSLAILPILYQLRTRIFTVRSSATSSETTCMFRCFISVITR